jgi:carboxyl-terminal processing protease
MWKRDKNKIKKRKGIVLLFVLASISLFAFNFSQNEKLFRIAKNLDVFATLFREVNIYYVDDVDPSKLIKKGIDAMLEDLDPYTTFIPEEEMEDYQTMITGEYGGVGALIGKRDGKIIVTMPYKGFPAQRSGIEIGDELLKINGVDIKEKNISDVSSLLKGQINTSIKILIRKGGSQETKEVTVTREKIKLNDVPYAGLVDKDIGYIKLIDFRSNASKELKNSIAELKKQGAQKIILDLRDNPGGLLTEAINTSNLFLPKGSQIVTTKGKVTDLNKTYTALDQPIDNSIPLVVLVDGQSASSSEIVSGAIQDYDRGVLIGEKTFGKGLVQSTHPLSYNAKLKITVQKYYIPSGRCIQAIDYKNKDANGKATKIADSLKVAFKTKNGRTVYDVGGITPDVQVDQKPLSSIAISLITKGLLFDYATEYHLVKKSISSVRSFQLSEEDYQKFIKWLKGKSYDYKTPAEKTIEELEKQSEKEIYSSSIKNDIKSLKEKIFHDKENDLEKNKEEVKYLLEQEIISRYYSEEGMIEFSFRYDLYIKEAAAILKDLPRYHNLLIKK